ncbi:MAG TPA: cytochrome c oxidase subunit II [Kofleriaceae bacterium]|jgi:cytochrome c oxidase subunit 2
MKPILRYTGTIAVTAAVALAFVVHVFGSSSADAQPQPQTAPQPAAPNDRSAATPPTVQQADKGAASSNAVGSNNAVPGPQPNTGSSAPPPAGAEAVGSGAAPAEPGKPSIVEVSCDNVTPATSFQGVVDGEVAVGSVVRFTMPPGVYLIPDNAASAGLDISGGQTRCLRFDKDGVFLYHSRTNQHGAITARQWYDILVNKQVEDLKGGNFWMPKAVNLTADDSDLMYYAVLGLSIFFFFGITGAVVYFVIKYRHRPGHKPEPSPAHNDALEITWTVIPTIICVFLFYYGWNTYVRVVTPPTKAVEINVLAWRWNWQFTHGNGVQDSDLHVPVNTPVRLVMTSKDVLHSFYAPVMRVKQDIIPRRYTYAWFFPTKPGTYRLTCAEYCGTNHSQMGITNEGRRAVLVVHEPGGYERYLADKAAQSTALPPEQLGRLLYEKKGCNACHTVDGSARVGPSWKGVFGTMVPLSDGTQVKMDENYIKESVLFPQAKSRPGFPPSMPSFEGQLKDREIAGIIAYIKSLK